MTSTDTLAPSAPNPAAPLVSVIMPAYNAAPFILESVATVLSQDYPHLELIVVDDGSSDGTPELVQDLDPRVRLLRQRNAGPAAARNRGIAEARGELLAFLDADDLWLPGKLRRQVAFLQAHPEVSIVYGGFLRWFERPDGSFPPLPAPRGEDAPDEACEAAQSGWIYTALLMDNIVHIITALIRRRVVDEIGSFDPGLQTGEDYDFWLRASRRFQAVKLARTLAFYRMQASSTTQRPRRDNNELRVLKAALASHGSVGPDGQTASAAALQERLFMLNFSHGYMHIRSGSAQVAQAAFREATRVRPGHLKSWLYLLASGLKRLVAPGNCR